MNWRRSVTPAPYFAMASVTRRWRASSFLRTAKTRVRPATAGSPSHPSTTGASGAVKAQRACLVDQPQDEAPGEAHRSAHEEETPEAVPGAPEHLRERRGAEREHAVQSPAGGEGDARHD